MSRRRILIVDDDLEAPRLLKRLLEKKRDYEVRLEHEGKKAAATALEFAPELVLMDVIMPDADGCDLARDLHAMPEMRDLPIVFISAVADPIAGYPFLGKPVSIDRIIETIEANLPPA